MHPIQTGLFEKKGGDLLGGERYLTTGGKEKTSRVVGK